MLKSAMGQQGLRTPSHLVAEHAQMDSAGCDLVPCWVMRGRGRETWLQVVFDSMKGRRAYVCACLCACMCASVQILP